SINGLPLADAPSCEVGATYTDQSINYCPPAGYTVIRTWLLIDFCSNQTAQRIQIIKVEDKKPPVLSTPPPLTVSTLPFQCVATVTLPQASASDSCSAVSVSVSWDYGNGYGPYPDIPVGEHTVTYVATDACGNSATRTLRLTVADQVPPQAVCKGALQLSLGVDGSAQLPASLLDGGSTDNCGSLLRSVSRDGADFFPALTFGCADRDSTYTLTLRVQDENGLENDCQTQVTLRDFLKPLLQCPPAITLNCLQDPADLTLSGSASATDNCGVKTLDYADNANLNGCHVGSVVRTWKAVDEAGNTRTCQQGISLKVLSAVQVAFPPDRTLSACPAPEALAPASTGKPAITGNSCFPPSVTYTDQVFQPAAPACFRILRKWKVIDFCVYDPNLGSAGIWEHTQQIEVYDSQPPLLLLPDDLSISPNLPDCSADISLPDATATDCSGQISLSHDSPYAAQPNGPNASGKYPAGIHMVTFTATDGCGNTAQKTLRIVVQDLTPPQAQCIPSLTINLQPNASANLSPAQVDAGSSDFCTPAADLAKSLSASHFDCQTLGDHVVHLQVNDAAGNTATCSTVVTVTDAQRVCQGDVYDLGGSLHTYDGRAVAHMPVRLNGSTLREVADCDSTGRFAFAEVAGQANYTVRPYANFKWLNGVSTYDLVLISKHILGLQPLGNPYLMIAADVNRSGSITTFDIVMLRRLILGIDDTLGNNGSWRFVPRHFAFPNPDNPFANGGFPEEISLPALAAPLDTLDFVAIKVGDLNKSADATQARTATQTVWLSAPDVALQPGLPASVPLALHTEQGLDGFQFDLWVDSAMASIQKVEFLDGALLQAPHCWLREGGGSAGFSWQRGEGVFPAGEEQALVVLHLLPRRSCSLAEALSLSASRMAPEAYCADNQELADIELRIGKAADALRQGFEVRAPLPNPLSDRTVVGYTAPAATVLTLTLSDAQGRLVQMMQREVGAGSGVWVLERDEFPQSGVFFLRLTTREGAMWSGKVVVAP
ncbi:MAG TPA: hypothetical protein PK858_01340, partial [Saprospiraceae bacterium]|nr:hypothetical protein [Saprospiraceae bacterium]